MKNEDPTRKDRLLKYLILIFTPPALLTIILLCRPVPQIFFNPRLSVMLAQRSLDEASFWIINSFVISFLIAVAVYVYRIIENERKGEKSPIPNKLLVFFIFAAAAIVFFCLNFLVDPDTFIVQFNLNFLALIKIIEIIIYSVFPMIGSPKQGLLTANLIVILSHWINVYTATKLIEKRKQSGKDNKWCRRISYISIMGDGVATANRLFVPPSQCVPIGGLHLAFIVIVTNIVPLITLLVTNVIEELEMD